ncbi:MAG: hypothetical protein AB7L91_16310 [Dehalococcoidia bacterium]
MRSQTRAGGHGAKIATVAIARKPVVICWHRTRQEDDLYARPALTAKELPRLELLTGAEHRRGHHPQRIYTPPAQHTLEGGCGRERGRDKEVEGIRNCCDWPECGSRCSRGPRPCHRVTVDLVGWVTPGNPTPDMRTVPSG